MVKKVIKTIVVVFGIIAIVNAIWGLTTDIAEDNYDLISVLDIVNLIVWPIIILCITGLMGKIIDWWGMH